MCIRDSFRTRAKGIAGGLADGLAEGVGVPSWVVWAGGTAALGLLGLGAYRIILAAAPIAVGAAARRYLPWYTRAYPQ